MRKLPILSLLLMTGACGSVSEPVGDSRAVPCGPIGAQPVSACQLQVSQDGKGTLILTLRQPEGGFRRLVWPKGGQLTAADGAEPLKTARLPGGGVEARIGGWVYHIAAKGGGLP